ncbi:MAG TPA: helix-hairpin-helix domain-containing protein [Candidatus Acidoferrum sp.]|jgi:competence ComEA-like helix-hairpin-helix protein
MRRLLRTQPTLLFAVVYFFLLASVSAATKKPPPQPININAATAEELQQVPGIGPSTAEKILQMRKSYGPFKRVDDLLSIRGIGKKRLDKMRKYLTVGKPAQKNPATPANCPGCVKLPSAAKTLPTKAKPPGPPPASSTDEEPPLR